MSDKTDTAAYERLTGDVFVYGSVSLALAVAQETGVIKTLCSEDKPLSSTDIAGQNKLKERYVREVLNSLVTSGLVQLEKGTGGKDGVEALYTVPQAHRKALWKAGVYSLVISGNARQFVGVKECFDLDGPLCVPEESEPEDDNPVDVLDEWGALMEEDLIGAILKTPGLQQRLENGIEALEVGCGTGRLSRRLATMFPKTRFTVTELDPESLETARKRAQEAELANVTFQILDVCQVPDDFKERFDWLLTVSVIHDLPHPLKALQGISRALKPGGEFSLVDQFVSSYVAENLGNKESAAWYAVSTFHCIPESFRQSDSEAPGVCWGEEKAQQLLSTAGLNVLDWAKLGKGSMDCMAVCMCQKPA